MPLTHTKTLIPCFIAASLVATACSGGDDGAANNADPADMSSPAQDMPEGDAPDRDAPVDEDMREGVDPLSLSVTDDGPFQVGWRTYEHTYQPRPDGPERTITVNLFYPTEATDGAPARYFDLLADRTAFRDAPLADSIYDGGTYPVQLHSHGHTGYAGAEGPWLFHFVRHGWVVVAPEHTNNTLFDNVSPRQMELYYQRPLDVRAALDSAADLPDEDPLAGKLDTDRVILSGHSFGGFTTWIGAGAALDADAVEARCAESQMEDGEGCTAEDLEVFGSDLSEPRAVAAIPHSGDTRPRVDRHGWPQRCRHPGAGADRQRGHLHDA